MLFSPHETLVASGTNTKQIEDQLLKYYILTDYATTPSCQLRKVTTDESDVIVYALVAGRDIEPKPFINPLRIEYQDTYFTVFDARPSTRYDTRMGQAVVNNVGLYRREMYRAFFQMVWQDMGADEILRLGMFQTKVFSVWVAEGLTRRLGLDPEQNMQLMVYAGYFHLSQFTEPGKTDKRKIAVVLARIFRLDIRYTEDLLERVGDIIDLQSFVDTLPDFLQTDRVMGISVDLMVGLFAGSWIGPNNALLVGMSLEYPPYFVTMMYLSLTDRSAKINNLSKIALRFERESLAQEFAAVTTRFLSTNLHHDLNKKKGDYD